MKLKIENFKISKIKNLSSIYGGNGDGDRTSDSLIPTRPKDITKTNNSPND